MFLASFAMHRSMVQLPYGLSREKCLSELRGVCASRTRSCISVYIYVEPAYSKWAMTKGGENQLAWCVRLSLTVRGRRCCVESSVLVCRREWGWRVNLGEWRAVGLHKFVVSGVCWNVKLKIRTSKNKAAGEKISGVYRICSQRKIATATLA